MIVKPVFCLMEIARQVIDLPGKYLIDGPDSAGEIKSQMDKAEVSSIPIPYPA